MFGKTNTHQLTQVHIKFHSVQVLSSFHKFIFYCCIYLTVYIVIHNCSIIRQQFVNNSTKFRQNFDNNSTIRQKLDKFHNDSRIRKKIYNNSIKKSITVRQHCVEKWFHILVNLKVRDVFTSTLLAIVFGTVYRNPTSGVFIFDDSFTELVLKGSNFVCNAVHDLDKSGM